MGNPLLPAMSSALGGAVLLFLIHLHLQRLESERAPALWALAWGFYALRLVAALALEASSGAPVFLWLQQAFALASAFFLLRGVWNHTGQRYTRPGLWLPVSVAIVLWISVTIVAGLPAAIVSVPVFVALAGANLAIAVAYLRTSRFDRTGRFFVFTVFVLWGLHKLDYPFLRDLTLGAVWGYTAAAVLSMAAGVGLLSVYLEEARREAGRQRQRFESLVSSLSDFVFTLDRDAHFSGVHGCFLNDNARSAEEYLGKSTVEVFGLYEGRRQEAMARKAFTEGKPVSYEWHVEDGELDRHFQTTLSPIPGARGETTELVGSARDITRLKHAQRAAEESLRQKSALLREVHHRVKNNMQMVVSMLRLRADYYSDPVIQEAFNEMTARVSAMALVHEQLYQSEDVTSVPFDEYLSALIPSLTGFGAGFGVGRESARQVYPQLDIDGEHRYVDMDIAVPLGLIAVELVTNAVKHAFAGVSDPRIMVEFRNESSWNYLTVRDNGIGVSEALIKGEQQSLGLTLVRSLTGQLQGDISLSSGVGTSVTVAVPVGNAHSSEKATG